MLFVCRICIKQSTTQSISFLPYTFIQGTDLEPKLKEIYPHITIPESTVQDNPLIICKLCKSQLETSYSIKIKCVGTEEKLKHYLENTQLFVYGRVNLAVVSNRLQNFLKQICRVCLEVLDEKRYLTLSNTAQGKDLQEMLLLVCNKNMDLSACTENHVCYTCILQLKVFCDLNSRIAKTENLINKGIIDISNLEETVNELKEGSDDDDCFIVEQTQKQKKKESRLMLKLLPKMPTETDIITPICQEQSMETLEEVVVIKNKRPIVRKIYDKPYKTRKIRGDEPKSYYWNAVEKINLKDSESCSNERDLLISSKLPQNLPNSIKDNMVVKQISIRHSESRPNKRNISISSSNKAKLQNNLPTSLKDNNKVPNRIKIINLPPRNSTITLDSLLSTKNRPRKSGIKCTSRIISIKKSVPKSVANAATELTAREDINVIKTDWETDEECTPKITTQLHGNSKQKTSRGSNSLQDIETIFLSECKMEFEDEILCGDL